MENIIFLGYGGHAKSVADCILSCDQYNIAGYTDVENRFCEYPYFGTDDALIDCYKRGIRMAVLGVGFLGSSRIRDRIVKKAKLPTTIMYSKSLFFACFSLEITL